MNNRFLTGTAVALSVVAGSALASDSSVWNFSEFGTAGDWNVMKSDDTGDCVMMRKNGDTMMQAGFAFNDPTKGYLGVFTTDTETMLDDGKTVKIELAVDGEDYSYSSIATEVTTGIEPGYQGAMMVIDNPKFVDDFVNKNTLTVHVKDGPVHTFSLEGTKAATTLLRECEAG
ncbi:hypothetical protein [Chachezhania antarctica]|uniref:hypothetical protein n=1 Tax=Chachezhania antarctica TaxID=2340860 RepID=UPI000EADA912|nr:hypothetical protein [Chachezhania antarctica]|tara:strand:- start:2905 stop:3423 length:519 start_codon:yes stop_codon:yes gene_type:complete